MSDTLPSPYSIPLMCALMVHVVQCAPRRGYSQLSYRSREFYMQPKQRMTPPFYLPQRTLLKLWRRNMKSCDPAVIATRGVLEKYGPSVRHITILNWMNVMGILFVGSVISLYSPAMANVLSVLHIHGMKSELAALCLILRCWGAVLLMAVPLLSAASYARHKDMLHYCIVSGLNWLTIASIELLALLHLTAWNHFGTGLFILILMIPLAMLYVWGRAIRLCAETAELCYTESSFM